jgi:phosphohistidine swiveling domain-containing protein
VSETRTRIGAGERVAGAGEFAGTVARADTVEEVLALAAGDLSDTVLLTEQAAASAFGPILPRVAGVICLRGGPSAHLAIVSRGLGLGCVMGVELSEDLRPGDAVVVGEDGSVFRA